MTMRVTQRRSFSFLYVVTTTALLFCLLWRDVEGLSSLSSAVAASSPLFRACSPPQGPQDSSLQPAESLIINSGSSSSLQRNSNLRGGGGGGSQTLSSPSNENAPNFNVQALEELGYPAGFRRALTYGAKHAYAKRYWIIDDSLSMVKRDGHFLLHTPQQSRRRGDGEDEDDIIEQAPCSRWNELQETVLQHALLAHHLDIPTDFRMLNDGTGHFRVPRTFGGKKSSHDNASSSSSLADVQHAQKILQRTRPRGVTPLTARVRAVHRELQQSVLRRLDEDDHQKVAVVIATDGLPTNAADDGSSTPRAKTDLQDALQALPADRVSVVIRLCTDDETVMDFYRQLEERLPHVQVLDDYGSEAARVHAHNPWLNYGLVLHRLREMACCGAHVLPLLRTLSQRTLSRTEVAAFCAFLMDWEHERDPASSSMSWEALKAAVAREQQQQDNKDGSMRVWNPMSQKVEPWVNLDRYPYENLPAASLI